MATSMMHTTAKTPIITVPFSQEANGIIIGVCFKLQGKSTVCDNQKP